MALPTDTSLPADFMAKFDRQGNPITDDEWVRLQGDTSYRFVLTTRQADDVCVITIWDGFDPYRMEAGPHLIFETTAFQPAVDARLGICLWQGEDLRWKSIEKYAGVRHASEEAARAYNIKIAEKLIGKLL